METKEKVPVNQITEGVIWKQLLLFFFPILFGTLFQQIYNTADTLIVGRFVGKEALAAVGGSASQLVNLIVGFFVGISSGASVVIAQFYGAADEKNLQKTLHTAFAFSAVGSVVIGVIGFMGSRVMLELMNTPADVLDDSEIYLKIYFCGMLFNLIYNMGAGVLRAVGDSKRPLYVLIAACVLNIVLDLLMVVCFGLGVAGVALATILSQAVSAVLVTIMLLRTKEIYRLFLSRIRIHGRHLAGFLRVGVPAGLESVMYNISNVVIQIFVNRLGTDSVAAWGTMGKIDAFYWMVINAFTISITTFVGQNYGAGKFSRMRKSVGVCMGMSLGTSMVITGLTFVLRRTIFSLFTSDASVIALGTHMMSRMLPWYTIYVVIGILSGALRGAGKVLVPMLLTCVGVCTLRIAWLFVMTPHYPGIDTIILSYPISWIITAVLFILYYFRRFPKSHENLSRY